MPAYIKFDGVDGESSLALFDGSLPIQDLATVSGTDFIRCSTGDPSTICVSLFFQTESTPYKVIFGDLVVTSFSNPVTGATGSRTYEFADGSFSAYGIYTSVDGGATLTLTLSPIPEAGVWLMLIAGFGLVGTALRRRRAPINAAP